MEARVAKSEVSGGGWAVSPVNGAGLGRPGQTQGPGLQNRVWEEEEWRRVCGKARWAPVKDRKGH